MEARKLLRLILILAVSVCAACDSASDRRTAAPSAQAEDPIVFPAQKQVGASRQALLIGTLVRNGPCLYVRSKEDGDNYLPVWPEGSSYESSGGKITILDSNQQEIAVLGDRVSMAGGVVGENKEPVPQEIEEQAAGCKGPYWIVGQDD